MRNHHKIFWCIFVKNKRRNQPFEKFDTSMSEKKNILDEQEAELKAIIH